MNPESKWTPYLCAQLTQFWKDGVTTVEMARRLGVTKNAVVGKAHRLGLEPRPSPVKRKAPLPPTDPKHPCRFIAGDPVALVKAGKDPYCGKPSVAGKSYCPTHAKDTVSAVQPAPLVPLRRGDA